MPKSCSSSDLYCLISIREIDICHALISDAKHIAFLVLSTGRVFAQNIREPHWGGDPVGLWLVHLKNVRCVWPSLPIDWASLHQDQGLCAWEALRNLGRISRYRHYPCQDAFPAHLLPPCSVSCTVSLMIVHLRMQDVKFTLLRICDRKTDCSTTTQLSRGGKLEICHSADFDSHFLLIVRFCVAVRALLVRKCRGKPVDRCRPAWQVPKNDKTFWYWWLFDSIIISSISIVLSSIWLELRALSVLIWMVFADFLVRLVFPGRGEGWVFLNRLYWLIVMFEGKADELSPGVFDESYDI